MLGQLTTLSAPALLGLLLGIALVIWIEPDTPGGTALIIVVAIALTLLIAQSVRALASFGKRRTGDVPSAKRRQSPPA